MRFTRKLGNGRRGGAGLVLGIVAPLMIMTACTAENESSGPTGGGTAAATASSVSKAPATTAPGGGQGATPGSPGGGGGADAGGGAGAPGSGGEQTDAPGGTDTCGATPCGATDTPAPAPGGTDTCGATPCGVTPTPGGTDTCGATPCGVTPTSIELWDPCFISSADAGGQGLRPDSETDMGSDADSRTCRWRSPGDTWELTVESTRATTEYFQQSVDYIEAVPVSLGSRTGLQFRARQDSNKIGCYVGVKVPFGTVLFITRNLQKDALPNPCGATLDIANNLVKYLH